MNQSLILNTDVHDHWEKIHPADVFLPKCFDISKEMLQLRFRLIKNKNKNKSQTILFPS